jgi:hypothetical protein
MNKPDSRRRCQAEIRAAADVLRRNWDPIGGGETPRLPADEYDSYAPRVVSLIESGFAWLAHSLEPTGRYLDLAS